MLTHGMRNRLRTKIFKILHTTIQKYIDNNAMQYPNPLAAAHILGKIWTQLP